VQISPHEGHFLCQPNLTDSIFRSILAIILGNCPLIWLPLGRDGSIAEKHHGSGHDDGSVKDKRLPGLGLD